MYRPLRHPNHKKPITRRDFLAQGFIGGAAMIVAPSLFGLFKSQAAYAQAAMTCNLSTGAGRIPFVCFDLAGGANIAGSNVLVGGPGGQLDFLSQAGYEKLGLPPAMQPMQAGPGEHRARPGLPRGQRVPARHPVEDLGHHARQRERRRRLRSLGERHREQSAQPDVRHQQGGRGRQPGHADRHGAVGLGRQLAGADVDDRSGRAAHEGRQPERRDRPRRHGAPRRAARAAGCGGGDVGRRADLGFEARAHDRGRHRRDAHPLRLRGEHGAGLGLRQPGAAESADRPRHHARSSAAASSTRARSARPRR